MSNQAGSTALQVDDLKIENRTAKLGTRCTFMPMDMLADSSLDRDKRATDDGSARDSSDS